MKDDPATPLRSKLAEVQAQGAKLDGDDAAVRKAAAERIDDIEQYLPILRRRSVVSDAGFKLYNQALEERARLTRLLAVP